MAYIAIYQDKEYKVDVQPQSEGVYKVFYI